jgi:hypothetical protein
MATKEAQSTTDFPTADGTEAVLLAFGIGGASQAAGTGRMIPISQMGQIPTLLGKASGVMTLAETRGGPLIATSSGTVIYTLQTFTMLPYTRTPGTSNELIYVFERQGLGVLQVNQSQYRGAVASQAAMIGLSASVVGDWCQRTDDTNSVYQLTALPYSTAGNWTKRAGANRPNIFYGALADNAALVNPTNTSGAIVGDWCTKTDAGGATYQLQTAGPTTIGNWVLRTDVDKPTTPQIKIHWNNLDPQYLAAFHPEVMIRSCGIGNDEWKAS